MSVGRVLAIFNGGSLAVIFLSGIPGSIVASLLLSTKQQDVYLSKPSNVSYDIRINDYKLLKKSQCGSHYCPIFKQNNDNNASSISGDVVTSSSLYVVMGIYLAINLCGIFVTAAFVKNVKPVVERKESKMALIKDIFKVSKNRNLISILFVVAITGSGNSLYTAIFTNVSSIMIH